jgi:F-type H+-transporting ATPase subunit b
VTALGLNLQTFTLDLIAFLVTAGVVGKWVFPPLTRALDAKKDELEATAKHELDAKKALEQAEKSAAQTLVKARESADEIIAGAHADAAAQIEAARVKAEAQTERMISEAREQLARDVQQARGELKSETAKLVAGAAENLLGEKLDPQHDAALIGRSLEAE